MTGAERAGVPWHRSFFLRFFAIAALVAVIAVVAAAYVTVHATTVAVRDEQRGSLNLEARTYSRLIDYAATHRSWDGADRLVARLAQDAGRSVAITDLAGRTLVTSDGDVSSRAPSQARATLDALDVDIVLRSTVEAAAPPKDATTTVPCADASGCRQYAVAPLSVVDARVDGPLGRPDDVEAWTSLKDTIDRCLRRGGLSPTLAVQEDFDVIVTYPDRHQTVAECAETARREVLAPFVAPPALLFVSGQGATADVFWDFSRASQARISLLAGAVLLVILIVCAVLARSVVLPMRRLATAAQRAGDGDLSARVPDRRGDEFGEVAYAFNQMADRRQELEEARRRLVSDVSHELRTPLTNVRGWLEAAQDGLVEPDERLISSLHEETLHLQRLVDDLHDLALGDAGELRLEREVIDLTHFVAQVADAFGAAAHTAGLTLEVDAAPGATMSADPVRLRQAAGNLVANALRHTPPGGVIRVIGAPDRIVVTDTGEGIPAADLPHVFDRFTRADPSRTRATGGSGLGLAIVRQIAEAHGGSVEIASEPGTGTRVTVRVAPMPTAMT
ncbi:sensor histidine kinase [Nocardioides lijunqiniae]|uniref:sensor histidine kinase n=1 Tax=Nocardioides lijunqiniae TaxID=2760832 RepID=UPI001877E51B|nr:HAMP domain-containing sensor histidine kinase [Nocardioides lijunqiniae]